MQMLIEHGHSHAQIMEYPPHLFGRYVVAVRRVEQQTRRGQVLDLWMAQHADFKALLRHIEAQERKAAPGADEGKKAALGLARALGMQVG